MTLISIQEAYGRDCGDSHLAKLIERTNRGIPPLLGTQNRDLDAYDKCNLKLIRMLHSEQNSYPGSSNRYTDLQGLSKRPWMFMNFATGLLYAGIASAMREVMHADSHLTEPEINARIGLHISKNIKHLRWAIEDDQVTVDHTANAFMASTVRDEPLLGSDLGVIAHSIVGTQERYTVILVQAKKVDTAGATAQVDRPHDSRDQLDRLTSSGMGHYLFYQTKQGGVGHPYVPSTVRPASEIWTEVSLGSDCDRRSRFSVGTYGRDLHETRLGVSFGAGTAFDFALLAASLTSRMDPTAARMFAKPEAAVDTLLRHYSVEQIVNITSKDGPGFLELKSVYQDRKLKVEGGYVEREKEILRSMKPLRPKGGDNPAGEIPANSGPK